MPIRSRDERAQVLLFTGHMIDAPGRDQPRFPADQAEVARLAIRETVEAERQRPGGVAFGIAGGASGGDILFHEVCAELRIPTRLYLVLPSSQYKTQSVEPAGGDWAERFDRLAANLPVRVRAESDERDDGIWQRANLWMLHDALAAGGENVTLIALWDTQEGDGPGGTGDLVQRAREAGARTIILDTKKLFGV
ncbi:MAG TPA: hypothetical protein VKK31_06335 [Thermoanaerobaculia bacterium]|nr:hypothetical protein [Thermoanaerobaculia bacterium]